MRISSFFVFTLAILLSCIAITTPSFAKMLNCERYDKTGENQYVAGAFDSWYPKTLQIPTQKFKSIPGRTALVFERATQELHSGHESKMLYTLLTSKKLLMKSPSMPGSARYKCDMTPKEVLAAQTSQTPSPTVKTEVTKCYEGVLESCNEKTLCGRATSGQWVDGTKVVSWEVTGWQEYVQEAKRRGLSCGVSEASSQSTTQSSASSTTSTLSKADKSKAFCKDIGFTAGTEKFGECVLKMMDK